MRVSLTAISSSARLPAFLGIVGGDGKTWIRDQLEASLILQMLEGGMEQGRTVALFASLDIRIRRPANPASRPLQGVCVGEATVNQRLNVRRHDALAFNKTRADFSITEWEQPVANPNYYKKFLPTTKAEQDSCAVGKPPLRRSKCQAKHLLVSAAKKHGPCLNKTLKLSGGTVENLSSRPMQLLTT